MSTGKFKLEGMIEHGDKYSTAYILKSGRPYIIGYPKHLKDPIHWSLTTIVKPDVR